MRKTALVMFAALATCINAAWAAPFAVTTWDNNADRLNGFTLPSSVTASPNLLTINGRGFTIRSSNFKTPDFGNIVPDSSAFWNLSGNGFTGIEFDITNISASTLTFSGTNMTTNDYFALSFKRYSGDTSLNANAARYWLQSYFPATLAPGASYHVVIPFNSPNMWIRGPVGSNYGLDFANDRVILAGWEFSKSSASTITFPMTMSSVMLVPEPATMSLLALGGLLGLKRRK